MLVTIHVPFLCTQRPQSSTNLTSGLHSTACILCVHTNINTHLHTLNSVHKKCFFYGVCACVCTHMHMGDPALISLLYICILVCVCVHGHLGFLWWYSMFLHRQDSVFIMTSGGRILEIIFIILWTCTQCYCMLIMLSVLLSYFVLNLLTYLLNKGLTPPQKEDFFLNFHPHLTVLLLSLLSCYGD